MWRVEGEHPHMTGRVIPIQRWVYEAWAGRVPSPHLEAYILKVQPGLQVMVARNLLVRAPDTLQVVRDAMAELHEKCVDYICDPENWTLAT